MKKIFFVIGFLAVVGMASVVYATEGAVTMDMGRFRPVTKELLIKTNDMETIVENQKVSVIAKLTPDTKVPANCSSRKEKDGLWHHLTIQECEKSILYDNLSNEFVVENTITEERERRLSLFLLLCLLAMLFMLTASKTKKGWLAMLSATTIFLASYTFTDSAFISMSALAAALVAVGVCVAGAVGKDKLRGMCSIYFYILSASAMSVYILLV